MSYKESNSYDTDLKIIIKSSTNKDGIITFSGHIISSMYFSADECEPMIKSTDITLEEWNYFNNYLNKNYRHKDDNIDKFDSLEDFIEFTDLSEIVSFDFELKVPEKIIEKSYNNWYVFDEEGLENASKDGKISNFEHKLFYNKNTKSELDNFESIPALKMDDDILSKILESMINFEKSTIKDSLYFYFNYVEFLMEDDEE